jgi:hypothetical protein
LLYPHGTFAACWINSKLQALVDVVQAKTMKMCAFGTSLEQLSMDVAEQECKQEGYEHC